MSTPVTPWSEFAWPDWVPQALREQIESFWSCSFGRGPAAWVENAIAPYNGGLPLGTRGAFWEIGGNGIVFGRYVHAWNNMGRCVRDDGSVVVVSGVATIEQARTRVDRVQARIAEANELAKRLELELRTLRAFVEGA